MKKCSSVLCALLLAAAGCRALDLGVQAGATFSGMMGQGFEDTKSSWVAYFAALGLPVALGAVCGGDYRRIIGQTVVGFDLRFNWPT